MYHYYKSLIYVDIDKINVSKGVIQFILMLIPMIYGYFIDNLPFGLLISLGTLSNIYVFGGTLQSKLKTVTIATLTLAFAMALGTITAGNMVLFGFLLFGFTVIPYYVCNALEIKGPSSTFFLVAYGLSSIMPHAPELFLNRAVLVVIGGLITIVVISIHSKLFDRNYEREIVISDYRMLQKLLKAFYDNAAFNEAHKTAVRSLMASNDALYAARPAFSKDGGEYERTLLLHHLAEGIYSEILDLHLKNIRPIPGILIEMMNYIVDMVTDDKTTKPSWNKAVKLSEEFRNLENNLYKVEEILFAPVEQINYKSENSRPHFMRRLLSNITPESSVFMMTIKYAVIMGLAIFIALLFHIDRPYWVALTVHSVLIGNTTVTSLQRAGARFIGTLLGIIVAAIIISINPDLLIVAIIIAITGGINEVFVGSNYALAMISITTQVLLMSGIAAGHISYSFAYLRIIDVVIGVIIAVLGVLILGRTTASEKLPKFITDLIHVEAATFHYLFSQNHYAIRDRYQDMFKLYLNVANVRMTYTNAYGEISNNKQQVLHYYPAIHLLEQINFSLQRVIKDDVQFVIDNEMMGQYLLAFENCAKYFERGSNHSLIDLKPLERYHQIHYALMDLQDFKVK
ncbi:FUSC family protein [Macrococcus epidermidis]|uniref:FUSC family protein n=1 Tax=Macrococcus epidermidis TaxID=1902580 RepID=UPI0020B722B4|nr:FUSC family protein [Macrococcus epidermidis]UTH16410.1 FUSC family protein [Macrococcus epidermidis]